jgi:hypothetical protein
MKTYGHVSASPAIFTDGRWRCIKGIFKIGVDGT